MKKKILGTHKSSTSVAERWPFVRSFMEVMCVIEVVAQLGTYRHSPDEVRGDFLTADLSLPSKVQHQTWRASRGEVL